MTMKPCFGAILLVLAGLLGLMQSPRTAHAVGPWYVAMAGSDAHDCLSPSTACATIVGAIEKAGPGDTVLVATGTYSTPTRHEVVLIAKDLTLLGGWNSEFTAQVGRSTVDARNERLAIRVESNTRAVIDRLVIQNGNHDMGGGVFCNGCAMTLSNSTVRNNTGWQAGGGGILNWSGTVTVTNSLITDNSGGTGFGGGIYSQAGVSLVERSTIRHNSGRTAGGIMVWNGTVVVRDSSVDDNQAEYMAGIYAAGSLTCDNCTITGNSGIAIYADSSGTVALNSSTIAKNGGSGVSVEKGSVSLQNTIVTANGDPEVNCTGSDYYYSLGYNILGPNCSVVPQTGDLVGVDPRLGVAFGSPVYFPIAANSPARDAGNPDGCMGFAGLLGMDERGAPRLGRCDIGAYEYTAPGPAALVLAVGGAGQATAPSMDFPKPLKAAVMDAAGAPVSGVAVVFGAPTDGASGTFEDTGTYSTTSMSDETGIAAASILRANGKRGAYSVTATVVGVPVSATFALTNAARYVAPDGTDDGDCLSPSTACETLGAAVDKAGAGETVCAAVGTYTASAGSDVVAISKNLVLSGGWDRSFGQQIGMSTIDGQSARRGVEVGSGISVSIDHFIVQHGYSTRGGGIYNSGVLALSNSVVRDNQVGGYNSNGLGGGIHNEGRLALSRCSIEGNTVEGTAGGIYNHGAVVSINNSTIRDNHSQVAGGFYNDSPGLVTISSSTIVANIAGGIVNYYPNAMLMRNSILAGNTDRPNVPSTECLGQLTSLGYNIIGSTYGCSYLVPQASDLVGLDPRLGSPSGLPSYYPLLADSPAIDGGNPAGCTDDRGNTLIADQRGMPRVGTCDIGAYEAALALTKYASKLGAMGPVSYSLLLENEQHAADLTNVALTDTLPAGLSYVPGSLSASNGQATVSDGSVYWSGTVQGAVTTTISFSATIEASQRMAITNTAVSSWNGAVLASSATVDTYLRSYLPIYILGWFPG